MTTPNPTDLISTGTNEWCDDCHGYTHAYYCPSLRITSKQSLTEKIVTAVYRSMAQYEDGTWFLDNAKAKARVNKLLATTTSLDKNPLQSTPSAGTTTLHPLSAIQEEWYGIVKEHEIGLGVAVRVNQLLRDACISGMHQANGLK